MSLTKQGLDQESPLLLKIKPKNNWNLKPSVITKKYKAFKKYTPLATIELIRSNWH